MTRKRRAEALLIATVLGGCNTASRADLDALRDRYTSDVNGLTARVIGDEEKLGKLEEGLGAVSATVNESRLGVATDLQHLALRFQQALLHQGTEGDALYSLLLDELERLSILENGRYDRVQEYLNRLGQRVNARGQSAQEDVAPIGTLATGRAYLGVVLLSNGQIDPRGLQQPRAYLDQSAIATAIARGYLDPGIIEMLNLHATALSPFPATSTPADLRTTSPLLDPVASTPNQARELVGQMALEGLLCDPSGRPLHVRDVDVIIPSEARAVYLFQRRDLYNSPPAPRPE